MPETTSPNFGVGILVYGTIARARHLKKLGAATWLEID
jgi:hypothetical protein